MRNAIAALILVASTAPAFADTVTITVRNQSSQTVDRINSFPVDEDGIPIEDNVGSLGAADILPGDTGYLEVTSDGCEVLHLTVGMQDEVEHIAFIDLCDDRELVVTDAIPTP